MNRATMQRQRQRTPNPSSGCLDALAIFAGNLHRSNKFRVLRIDTGRFQPELQQLDFYASSFAQVPEQVRLSNFRSNNNKNGRRTLFPSSVPRKSEHAEI